MSTPPPAPQLDPREVADALRGALRLAVRAPSLHNSQPWLWLLGRRAVRLYLDTTRRLPAADARGRELVISCGAALHHLLVALAAQGWESRVHRLPDPADPTLLAEVQPVARTAERMSSADVALADAIDRRRSDRRRFSSWPVPAELLGELMELARLQGLRLEAVTDPTLRWRLWRAVADATARQAEDPAYAAELKAWSGRGPGSLDGVPAASSPDPHPVPGQLPMRPFARPKLAQPDTAEPEGGALLLLSSPGDTALQWLHAGEATSAVLLAATRAGVASSVLTHPFEVDDVRSFVGRSVSAVPGLAPQVLLRVGWLPPGAAELPATPRRPLAYVVRSWDE